MPSSPGGPVSVPSAAGALRNPELLGVYVNDHLAAATGGIELVSRMVSRHRQSEYEPKLEQLLDELRDERAGVRRSLEALGLPVRQYKQAGAWIGRKLSPAQPDGRP